MHIPKTAGTSLRAILEARFDPERTLPSQIEMDFRWGGHYPPIPGLLEIPGERWQAAQLLRGHYPWQVGERFDRPPVLLTMLRDPVERSLSHLRHVQRTARWAVGLSLEEIAARSNLMESSVANLQTRMLAMRFDLNDPDQWPKDINRRMTLDDDELERAVDTLRRFNWIGLQERFEESMALMFSMFGWPLPDSYPHANVGPGGEVGESLRRRLQEHNAFDLLLYEEARGMFERRVGVLQGSERSVATGIG